MIYYVLFVRVGFDMKKVIPKFRGTPTNGVMSVRNIEQFTRYLHTLEGVECEVVVKKYRKQRSLPQNNYYFGVVCVVLGNKIGYTVDEMHSAIGLKFLLVSEEGKPDYIRSTTDLDTDEFNDFLEQVKQWAAEFHNCYIPDPNESDF